MATFSIGDAAMSGVRIIREHPKAVLVWSLAYFVIVLLPQFGALALFAPELMAGEEAARSTVNQTALDLGRTVLVQLIQFITSALWGLALYGAVFRTVLEPENSSRWYIRVGQQEFLLGAVYVVASSLLCLAMIVAAIPIFVLIFASSAAAGGAMAVSGIAAVLIALVGLLALCWAAIRLSLAFPMSFERRSFQLFESWAVTRGHAARIFLVNLAAGALAIILAVAVMAVLFGFGLGAGAIASGTGRFSGGSAIVWPSVLVAGAVVSVLMTVVCTITAAPIATIYQRLKEPLAPAQAA